MAEFRPIIINLLLLSLFAVAIITGGTMIALQNGGDQSIINDTEFNMLTGNLTSTLENNYRNTSQVSSSFENSSVTLTGGIPFIDSIYGTWKVIKTTPVLVYNLVSSVIFDKLLGDRAKAIIIAVLSTILMITIIFAIVKLVSTGEGG